MLLPYSASAKRRSIFWALLWVTVLAMAVFIWFYFIPLLDAPSVVPWLLGGSAIAVTFLCVLGAVYARKELGLVRSVLIGGAVFFQLLTALTLRVAIAPSIICERPVRADIQSIRTMLLSYRGTTGHYPSTEQGLNALVPRLLEELPNDAYGSPYVYRYPGRKNPNGYDLFSAGPDRVPDTADDEWGE